VPFLNNQKLLSIEDGHKFVLKFLPTLINVSDAVIANGLIKRISMKVLLYSNSIPAPKDGNLSKLLKSAKIRESNLIPLVQLNYKDGVPRITFLIPGISDDDSVSKRNIEGLATLAHYACGVPIENIFLMKDTTFGDEFTLDSQVQKLIDELSSSAASPTGAYPSGELSIGSYKGNLPCILSCLHMLNLKLTHLRRRTPKKGEKVSVVTPQELRNAFNLRSGLQKPSSFGIRSVRALLAVITSASNKRFPGGWIRSNRLLNSVNTDLGLINILGYTEKLPYNHKLVSILETDTVEAKKGLKLRSRKNKEEFKEFSFIEYRSGVALTLPRITQKKDLAFDKQVSIEPLSCKDPKVIKNFEEPKFFKTLDLLNRAHAILVACSRKNSKSTPAHYEQARNAFLHSTDKLPIRTYEGLDLSRFKDIPENYQNYLRKSFRFRSKPKDTSGDTPMKDTTFEETYTSSVQVASEQIATKAAEHQKSVPPKKKVTRSAPPASVKKK
jgi:hypothetical protein